MEYVLQMLPGVVLVGVCYVVYLGMKHGWGWVAAQAKARANAAEAAALADKAKLIADIKAELAKANTVAPAAPVAPVSPVVQA
jgi:hypothetical protein